jgi:hypothetical protein
LKNGNTWLSIDWWNSHRKERSGYLRVAVGHHPGSGVPITEHLYIDIEVRLLVITEGGIYGYCPAKFKVKRCRFQIAAGAISKIIAGETIIGTASGAE